MARYFQVYKFAPELGVHSGAWLSAMGDGAMRWVSTRGDGHKLSKSEAEAMRNYVVRVYIGSAVLVVPDNRSPLEVLQQPRPRWSNEGSSSRKNPAGARAPGRGIPKGARDFALSHKLNLGRDSHGVYFVRDPASGEILDTTANGRSTVAQVIAMMRRVIKRAPPGQAPRLSAAPNPAKRGRRPRKPAPRARAARGAAGASSGARFRYLCHVAVPRARAPRSEFFEASSDSAASIYCRGLLMNRFPKGSRPVHLERLGPAAPRARARGGSKKK